MHGIDQDIDRQGKRLANLRRNAEAVAEILSDRIARKEGASPQPAIWLDNSRLDAAFDLYLRRIPAYRGWVGSPSLTNAAKIAALTILCILENRPLQCSAPGAAKNERLFSNAYLGLHIACNFMRVSLEALPERLQYGFMRCIIMVGRFPEKTSADPADIHFFRQRITLIVHLIELLFRKTGAVMPME